MIELMLHPLAEEIPAVFSKAVLAGKDSLFSSYQLIRFSLNLSHHGFHVIYGIYGAVSPSYSFLSKPSDSSCLDHPS